MNFAENNTFLSNYAGDLGYTTDPDFQAQLPAFIRAGELRILRDLDLLTTRQTSTSGALTANNRNFVLPTDLGKFQIVETVSLKMSYAQDITGTLFVQPPLLPVSKEFLDAAYPDPHAVGVPSVPIYIAPIDDDVMAVGPAAGLAYPLVVYGVVWPVTLSGTNTETYISVNMPDLFLAAQMIDASLWLRQFGTKADEAQMAVDWNAEYERLLKAMDVVDARSSFMGAQWGTRAPNPVAQQK